ncbi:MAG: T9SS type A sorting domain-containing protein [Candidatus Electryonea clarkiae]|nr:T9SS type A sorting domain-containing protein [Candidatus Electryonea clarkiae]MDP8286878.1 T9SS type A sorting domain-containing protein [Candidatus Electryonea clarkiae]
MKRQPAFILILLLYLTFPIQATIINVPVDQPTIQDGIDFASEHDTVLVDTGLYMETINFNGNNIVVGSIFMTTNDTSHISQTVLNGDSSGSVVTFESGEDQTTVLDGFTITNGSGREQDIFTMGGGIYIGNSDPVLKNLIICANNAYSGAGIYCEETHSWWTNLTIVDNFSSSYGGGITVTESNLRITDSIIRSNNSRHDAGGIFCAFYTTLTLENVVISENESYRGAGISCYGPTDLKLINTTIFDNEGFFTTEGIFCRESDLMIVNSIIWGNSEVQITLESIIVPPVLSVSNSDIEAGEEGIISSMNSIINWLEGNIDLQPLFANAEEGDLKLQSNSPCIDAGTAFFVWEGDTIVNMSPDEYIGDAPDMGAYEYGAETVHEISHSTKPDKFSITSFYPNPFNSSFTTIVNLPQLSLLEINLFNILGHQVLGITKGNYSPGTHSFNIKASELPSGIYFIHAEVPGDMDEVRKIILIR